MEATFFESPVALRQWLGENHDRVPELWIGFYKKDSGLGGITYAEALDEALCYGWIDGVRQRVDAVSFRIRFTPRKVRSIWSAVNIKRAGELEALGRMQPAGLAAYQARDDAKSRVYAYEQASATLSPADEREFRADSQAWAFFQAQPPGYRQTATWWVISAKQEATRQRRLATLIADSAQGRRLGAVTYTAKG